MGMHIALKASEGARVADTDAGVVCEQRADDVVGSAASASLDAASKTVPP